MNKKSLSLVVVLFSLMFSLLADEVTLQEVDINAIKTKCKKYNVNEDGEANVKGEFIKRIEVGKKSITITFYNKKNIGITPRVMIECYNKYGMYIGMAKVWWIMDTIPSGEKHTEIKDLYITDFKKMFKFSKLKVLDDFNVVTYIVVDSRDL